MRFARNCVRLCCTGLMIALAAGCQGRASIPSDALLEESGLGKLSYTAHQAGNVYLLDSDANQKVFEGHLRNDDQTIIDPDQDRIIVAGNMADHSPALNPNHRYQVFFYADK